MSKVKEVEAVKVEAVETGNVWDNRYKDTELFVRKNIKPIAWAVGGIFVLALLYVAYLKLYLAPRETEAKDQIFRAQSYFEVDSLDRAVKGDGSNPGFEGIVSDYSGTESANLAHFYLGSAYLRKGEYQKAIENLEKYKAKDDVTGSEALGMIGDANSELKNYDQAVSWYEKAAAEKPNAFTSAMYLQKEALVYEHLKNYAKALEIYQRIRSEYSQSHEGRDVSRYIARVQQKL